MDKDKALKMVLGISVAGMLFSGYLAVFVISVIVD